LLRAQQSGSDWRTEDLSIYVQGLAKTENAIKAKLQKLEGDVSLEILQRQEGLYERMSAQVSFLNDVLDALRQESLPAEVATHKYELRTVISQHLLTASDAMDVLGSAVKSRVPLQPTVFPGYEQTLQTISQTSDALSFNQWEGIAKFETVLAKLDDEGEFQTDLMKRLDAIKNMPATG
jgi:hypothetical protein